MKEQQIKLFGLEELAEDIQDKLIEEQSEQLRDDYSTFFLEEDIDSQLSYLLTDDTEGCDISSLKVQYSLSYSQGDGVAFVGKLYKKDAPLINFGEAYFITFDIHGHYTHANSFNIEAYDDNHDEIQDQLLIESLVKQFQDISIKLEEFGYSVIEQDFTDQAREYLIDLGDVFLKSGKVFNGELV